MNVYNIYVYLYVYVRFDREKRQTDSLTLSYRKKFVCGVKNIAQIS